MTGTHNPLHSMVTNVFENIRKKDENGNEFWSARELYRFLGYTEYGKFLPAIERAKEACRNSGQKIEEHFAHVSEMVPLGSGAERGERLKKENDS